LIWHVQNKETELMNGNNLYGCGEYDNPCNTIEFALTEISYMLTGDYNTEY
jgi:hypothetical protein